MQARPDAFKGVVQCLSSTLKQEGVSALWKGSVPALVSGRNQSLYSVPNFCDPYIIMMSNIAICHLRFQVGAMSENAVAFSVNQQLKRFIKEIDGQVRACCVFYSTLNFKHFT